tara:strand:+ start:108 stop:344 length:237 start_codon:yes stop_codon:yes gene_type:complete
MNLDEKITKVKKVIASPGITVKVQVLAREAGLSVEENTEYVKLLMDMHKICMIFETQRAMRAKGYSEEDIIRLTEAIE